MADDWLIWQLADSAFPTGSFAHSGGLEAAWQSGEVPDAEALRRLLRASVLQAGHAALPLVTAAYREPERLAELDTMCDAFLTNAVANRASRVQGRAFVATCARTWRRGELDVLVDRLSTLSGHHAPLFGVSLSILGVPLATAQRLFLFAAARTVLAAAVRLGIVGSYHAQRMQQECAADVKALLDQCADLGEHDLAQTAPIMDILQSAHDRLYSRLFQS
jgi:urease accessory protein